MHMVILEHIPILLLEQWVYKNPEHPNQKIYSIPVNTSSEVETYGYGISLDYSLPMGFTVGGNLHRMYCKMFRLALLLF